MARNIIYLSLALLIILFAGLTAIRGVDFGYHWDETHTLSLVRLYVRNDELLPSWYEWPPMLSYAAYLATLPYRLPLELANYPAYYVRDTVHTQILENPTFALNARKVLITLTYLTPVWVLLGLWTSEKKLAPAVASASFLALSWEINYHSRWIAPDALTMQFGALTMLCAMVAFHARHHAWLWLALGAIAAAAAAASKYPAALVILPVVVAAYKVSPASGRAWWLRFVPCLLGLALVCLLTFVVIVPGVLQESELFWQTIRSQVQHYASGHGRQTVIPGLSHLSLMLGYLAAVFFSPYPPLALAIFGLALLGIHAYIRERQWLWLALLLIFPVAYLGLFSRQSVLFVRNILIVTPFLAVLAGKGAYSLYGWFAKLGLRRASLAGLVLLVGANGVFLWGAAQSILDRGTPRFAQDFLAYAQAHPEESIYISPQVHAQLLQATQTSLPSNLTFEITEDVDKIAAMFYEAMEIPGYWWVNRIGAAPQTFGPMEVNLDYYAFWRGDDRILLASPEQAKELEFKPEFLP